MKVEVKEILHKAKITHFIFYLILTSQIQERNVVDIQIISEMNLIH